MLGQHSALEHRRRLEPNEAQRPLFDDAVAVESKQLDHVFDVGLIVNPACGRARLAGEDRVIDDPPLLDQLGPQVLRESEVGGVVAVQVTELAAANLERELAAVAGPCLHPGPGGDLLGDLVARCFRPGRERLLELDAANGMVQPVAAAIGRWC